jgi:hypothetical protein
LLVIAAVGPLLYQILARRFDEMQRWCRMGGKAYLRNHESDEKKRLNAYRQEMEEPLARAIILR